MAKVKTPRFGWALTGLGHLFLGNACAWPAHSRRSTCSSARPQGEVVRTDRQDFKLAKTTRVFRDTTASAAPVGLFYYGVYRTLVLARDIDLQITERLKSFEVTTVVESLEQLEAALQRRQRELHG